jgi:hypothetical protein
MSEACSTREKFAVIHYEFINLKQTLKSWTRYLVHIKTMQLSDSRIYLLKLKSEDNDGQGL